MYNDLALEISRRLDELGFIQQSDLFFNKHVLSFSKKSIRTASKNDDIDKTIISAKHMKGGFEIRKEIWSAPWTKADDIEIETVYNHHGDYIGDKKTAQMLIEKGIVPEISQPEHSVCSIGYSPDSGKWFGWSHRAIKGFGIGDEEETSSPLNSTKSKEKISNLVEAKQAAIKFAESVS